MENRYRFIHEVIAAVRLVIPQDRLLFVRVSNWGIADMDVSLFESKAEWQEMIQLFSREPIDAISLSTYYYSEKSFGTDQNMSRIPREVTNRPSLIWWKIHDRRTADGALQDAELIRSAKSMLLNPNWVAEVEAAKELKLYGSDEAGIAYSDTPLP